MTAVVDDRAADPGDDGSTGEPERPTPLPRILALDGLRGLAVLAVVAFHLWPGAVPGGWLGVDVFFVLSGYLITGLLVTELAGAGAVAFGGFWARRARRLLPAALVTIAVVAVASHWLLDPWRLSGLRGDALASLGYVANWRFIATGSSYFAAGSRSPLEHLWSLAIEEQFYVVWPVVLLVVWRATRGRAALVAMVTGLLAVASALRMASLAHAPGSRAYFGTDTRAQALLIGAVVALALHEREVPARVADLLRRAAPAALFALATAAVLLHGTVGWLDVGGFTAIALATAVVVAALVTDRRSPLARGLRLRPLRAVGRVSYGLYLWHWPVIVLLTSSRVGVGGAGLAAIQIATFTALTIASHRLVEAPVRRWVVPPRTVAFRSAPAMAGVAVVVLLAALGSTAPPRQLQAAAGSVQTIPPAPSPASTAPSTCDPACGSGTIAPHPHAGSGPGGALAAGAAAVLPAPPPVPPLQVGVVGDSIGFTLAYYAGAVPGIHLSGGGTIGCGLIATERCAHWDELWKVVGARDPAVVVVVLGAWEVVHQGTIEGDYRPGTAAARATVLSHLEHGLSLLPAHTRLAVLDVPCLKSFDGNGPVPDDLLRWINGVFGDFVASHADRASIVPISQLVCPNGRWDASIDGVPLRPEGRHFDKQSAPLVWRWLGPRILAVAGR